MGFPPSQRPASHLRNSLFRPSPSYPLASLFRIPWQRFIPHVFDPLFTASFQSRADS
jgi:hypothetical protein